MALYTIDESQRKASRIAGIAYLFTLVTVVYVNFGIHDRLIVANNAAETARNILAHERLFRIGIVAISFTAPAWSCCSPLFTSC